MKFKLPPALANHLVGQTNKPMTFENVAQIYKTAFPGFQSMESNLQKVTPQLGTDYLVSNFPIWEFYSERTIPTVFL